MHLQPGICGEVHAVEVLTAAQTGGWWGQQPAPLGGQPLQPLGEQSRAFSELFGQVRRAATSMGQRYSAPSGPRHGGLSGLSQGLRRAVAGVNDHQRGEAWEPCPPRPPRPSPSQSFAAPSVASVVPVPARICGGHALARPVPPSLPKSLFCSGTRPVASTCMAVTDSTDLGAVASDRIVFVSHVPHGGPRRISFEGRDMRRVNEGIFVGRTNLSSTEASLGPGAA